MKIFGLNINITKADPKLSPSEQAGEMRAKSIYVLPWQVEQPLPTTNYDFLISSFKSWVYVCASKNAQSVAKAPLKLYIAKKSKKQKFIVKTKTISREEDLRLRSIAGLRSFTTKAIEGMEEVTEHPFLEMIKSVNPMINRFDLWELTELFLELTGNAYWYVVKGQLGTPSQIWIIPSQGMKIVPGKENMILGYVYQQSSARIPFDYEEIIHFKFPSLTSQMYGSGPMAAVVDAYVYDQRIKTFENTLLNNMGKPEGVLQTDQGISDADYIRLTEKWKQNYGGESKVGKTLILEKGLKYQGITMTPREMNYIQGRKFNREEIAATFGVPMSKLTSESVNRANALSGEVQYLSDTIEPRCRRLEEKINERLMPMYDETGSLFVAYDNIVPRDDEYRLRERESNLRSQYSSVNLERRKDGEDDVEWGDIPLVAAGIAPLGSQPPAPPGGAGPDGFPPGPPPPLPGEKVNPDVTPPKVDAAKPPPKGEEMKAIDIDDLVDRVMKEIRR